MGSIKLSCNKTLKLTNALIREFEIKEGTNLNIMISQMENHIKTKGAVPVLVFKKLFVQ